MDETKGSLLNKRGERAERTAGGSVSILVIEDHVETAIVMSRLLSAAGYQVHLAGTGAEAIRTAELEKIDVIVSDINLPDTSGYEVMAAINSHKEIKGIALSGHDLEAGEDTGPFSAYMVKPVELDDLILTIRSLTAGLH